MLSSFFTEKKNTGKHFFVSKKREPDVLYNWMSWNCEKLHSKGKFFVQFNKNKIEKYSTNEIPFEIETCIHSKPYNLDAIKIIPLFTM